MLHKALAEAVKLYQHVLLEQREGADARQYLSERGISNESLERFAGKPRIDAFGFLQANDVRPPIRQPLHHVVDPLLDRIDVPAGDAHGKASSGVQS